MSNIDQVLTDITFAGQRGGNVDYDIDVEEGGETLSHLVRFVLDEDGIWRIRFL